MGGTGDAPLATAVGRNGLVNGATPCSRLLRWSGTKGGFRQRHPPEGPSLQRGASTARAPGSPGEPTRDARSSGPSRFGDSSSSAGRRLRAPPAPGRPGSRLAAILVACSRRAAASATRAAFRAMKWGFASANRSVIAWERRISAHRITPAPHRPRPTRGDRVATAGGQGPQRCGTAVDEGNPSKGMNRVAGNGSTVWWAPSGAPASRPTGKRDEPPGRERGATNPQPFAWSKPSRWGRTTRAERESAVGCRWPEGGLLGAHREWTRKRMNGGGAQAGEYHERRNPRPLCGREGFQLKMRAL
jgi:hypothetical protein